MEPGRAAGHDLDIATGAEAAASTASASALASKTSTARASAAQCRGPAVPRRTPRPAASPPPAGRRHRPGRPRTARYRQSPAPGCGPVAAIRLGSSEGRMSDSSDEIGLASLSSGCPPPNSRAWSSARNDQVTASLRPRAASAAWPPPCAAAMALSTGRATAWSRRMGVERHLIEPDDAADFLDEIRLRHGCPAARSEPRSPARLRFRVT